MRLFLLAAVRVGPPRFLVDLRPARADAAVTSWLVGRRSLGANYDTHFILSLGTPLIVIVFIKFLSPARTETSP